MPRKSACTIEGCSCGMTPETIDDIAGRLLEHFTFESVRQIADELAHSTAGAIGVLAEEIDTTRELLHFYLRHLVLSLEQEEAEEDDEDGEEEDRDRFDLPAGFSHGDDGTGTDEEQEGLEDGFSNDWNDDDPE